MSVDTIHAAALIVVLAPLAFIAGILMRLKKHNTVQDDIITNIKSSHSADISAIKENISTIKKDIDEVEKDLETISAGQLRMYSDFKDTLEQALKPLTDSNNRQAERLDRVLEMIVKAKG